MAVPQDTVFDLVSGLVLSGTAWKLRVDSLRRYVYPAGFSDTKCDVRTFKVIHADVGTSLEKGPVSDRPFQLDVVAHLKRIFNFSNLPDTFLLSPHCYICGGCSVSGLSTCRCCLLTAHDTCTEQLSFSLHASFSLSILCSRFNDRNMCCHCQRCFT